MAADEIPITIDGESLMGRVTVKVTVHETRRFRLRKWLGLRLMALGANLTGMTYEEARGDDSPMLSMNVPPVHKPQGFESISEFRYLTDELIRLFGADVFMIWTRENGTKAGLLALLPDTYSPDRQSVWEDIDADTD